MQSHAIGDRKRDVRTRFWELRREESACKSMRAFASARVLGLGGGRKHPPPRSSTSSKRNIRVRQIHRLAANGVGLYRNTHLIDHHRNLGMKKRGARGLTIENYTYCTRMDFVVKMGQKKHFLTVQCLSIFDFVYSSYASGAINV